MKNSLQLRLSQHLTLTPQLQQSIKLLQLSTVELNQELERYLLENPLLERVDMAGEADESPALPFNGQTDFPASGQTETTPGSQSNTADSADSRHDDAGFNGDDGGANYSSGTRANSSNSEDTHSGPRKRWVQWIACGRGTASMSQSPWIRGRHLALHWFQAACLTMPLLTLGPTGASSGSKYTHSSPRKRWVHVDCLRQRDCIGALDGTTRELYTAGTKHPR